MIVKGAGGADDLLIAQMREALDLWDRQGEGSTSSLTGGGAIALSEGLLKSRLGTSHALLLPSGTFGLRTALVALEVEAGQEVVCPALDWPAAVSAILSVGAKPIPADVSPGTFLVDPGAIVRSITERTAAVIVTHPAGVPAEIRTIVAGVRSMGIPVIEDISQALGAMSGGQPVGSFGDIAVLSMGPGKILDCGEGGALVTANAVLFERAVEASQHPIRQLRSGIDPVQYLQFSGRINPYAAILLFSGLRTLESRLHVRRTIANEILDRLEGLERVSVPRETSAASFAWPCVPAIVCPSAVRALSARGIAASPLGIRDIVQLLAATGNPVDATADHWPLQQLELSLAALHLRE